MDRTSSILSVDRAGARLLGRERGDLAGLPLESLVAGPDRRRLRAHLGRVARDGRTATLQVDLQGRDGSSTPVLLVSTPDRTRKPSCIEMVVVGLPCGPDTALAQGAVLESGTAAAGPHGGDGNLLRVMTDSLLEMFWTSDPSGAIDFCNPSTSSYGGVAPEAITGWGWTSIVHPDDLEGTLAAWRSSHATGEPYAVEHRLRRADGVFRWYVSRAAAVRDTAGRVERWVGTSTDVHELREARESQREVDALLHAVTEEAFDSIYVKDAEGRFLLANPTLLRTLGRNAAELIGRTAGELQKNPALAHALMENDRRIMAQGRTEVVEEAADTVDGRRVFLSAKVPRRNAKGQVIGLVGISRDITERKQAEEALEAARAEAVNDRNRLAAVLEALPVGVAILDARGGNVASNPAFEKIWGPGRPLIEGIDGYADYKAWWTETDRPLTPEEWASARAIRDGETVVGQLLRIERFDGTPAFVHNSAAPIRDAAGRITGSAVALMDVTKTVEAEASLREAKRDWERTFDSVPDLIAILDRNHRIVRANRAMAQRLARTPGECVGLTCFSCVHGGASVPIANCPHSRTLRDQREHVAEIREARLGGDFLVSTTPLFDERGQLTGSVHVARDITERNRMEESLRESDRRLRAAVESLPHGFAIYGSERRYEYANAWVCRAAGHRLEEIAGRRDEEVFPEEACRILVHALEQVFESKRSESVRWQMPDALGGALVIVQLVPLVDEKGAVRQVLASYEDVTETTRKEAALLRLNRTLEAISDSSQAMLQATSEVEYIQEVCRIVVETCGYAMAWIGFAEDGEGRAVRVVAHAGREDGYLDTVRITWADDDRGRGPTGTAIRTGLPAGCGDTRNDPAFQVWRSEALARGYASSIALPLLAGGRAFGALTIYSAEREVFSREDVALLSELASDLAFGIGVLRLREESAAAAISLRQREERYRALVEMSPEAILVNRADRIVYVNPAAVALFGATDPSQLVGRTQVDLFHPAEHAKVRGRLSRLRRGERVPLVEERIVRLDGVVRFVEAIGTPFEDSEGAAIQVLLRDVTARRRAEEQLKAALEETRRREAEIAALLDAARMALESRVFEEAAGAILERCRAAIGAPAGAVLVRTPALETMSVACREPAGLDWRPGETAPASLREARKRALGRKRGVTAGSASPNDSSPAGEGRPFLVSPLVISGEVAGFLELADKPGGFTAKDAALASAFAEMMSVALLDSRTLDILEGQVRERTGQLEKASETLAAERERLFSLLDELPVFVFLRGPDHSVIFANRYLREHFGEALGKRCYDVMGGGNSPCSSCQAADVMRTGCAASWGWTSNSGSSFQIHNFPFVDTDGTRLILEVGVDVTELTRAYDAEQRARRFADTFREAMHSITRSLDLDTVLTNLLQFLVKVVPYDRGRVMILEPDGRLSSRALLEDGKVVSLQQDDRTQFETAANAAVEQVLTSGGTVMLPDIRTLPDWQHVLPKGAGATWLGVPLIARGRPVGMFSLSAGSPGAFDEEHVRLAEGLSAQASVAIENALLFEEVRTARERMQALSRSLVEAQENERRAVARELHDEAGQSLSSLLLGLRLLERNGPTAADAGLGVPDLIRTAEAVLEDLHRLASNLRPASLEHLGLEAAIRQHLSGVERKSGMQVRFSLRGLGPDRLPAPVESAAYRVVQEAVTNVVRHAAATSVDVLVERRGDRLSVMVEDDGAGFDAEVTRRPERLGLVGMKERAEALGGTFTVETSPGSGTTIFVEVPCANPHPDSR